MIDLKATIEGDQDLMVKFEHLTKQGVSRAMRSAIGVGQNMIRKAIRVKIPAAMTPGHDNTQFRDSIGSRLAGSRSFDTLQAKTGINVGKNKVWAKLKKSIQKGQRKSAYQKLIASSNPHFHLLALGTAIRRTRFGANRGMVKPGNYIPDAIASVSGAVGAAMENKLRERVYAEALKGH